MLAATLTGLHMHPMRRGTVAPLVVAIQYAVVVDTSDSGSWGHRHPLTF